MFSSTQAPAGEESMRKRLRHNTKNSFRFRSSATATKEKSKYRNYVLLGVAAEQRRHLAHRSHGIHEFPLYPGTLLLLTQSLHALQVLVTMT
ncbi:hypothetical protein BaRGS_00021112 [Batillaria attramentaria]|uniref:Uncharacterized protein n=1 Tax=Batillaria attramentaria TaxID=370345 RepID=A0ABD0KKY1_9CAEN